MSKNTCNFTRVVPSTDPGICTNLNSVASFKQGCFSCDAMDLKRRYEINNWISENSAIIDSIECFLLKHPLFEFPIPLYPMFQFVHHAQLGFIFKDKDGKQIRHLCLQLQNAWWPPVSATAPFNLAQPCKIVNPDGTSKIVTNLVDQTAIFANFLEKENYVAERVVDMNKYTYFKGINMQYLSGTVNFNFFLESYRIWRMQNTAISDQEYQKLLKEDPSEGLGEEFAFNESFGQNDETTTKLAPLPDKPRLNGNGDGKLFVLSTFSPSYWSLNEGAVLHFATLKQDNQGGVADRFNSFIDWTFNNLQCYDNPLQHIRSYARNYITLSTSALSLDWIKANAQLSDDEMQKLSNALRPMGNTQALWSTTTDKWDDNGVEEQAYKKALVAFEKCRNIGQLTPKTDDNSGTCTYDYSSCPLVVTGTNYNCEIWAAMVISMILNTNTFNSNGVTTERMFNFNFPGAEFVPDSNNSTKPANEKTYTYQGPTNSKPENITPDADYSLSDNLMRMYSAYWPVALYDNGYEKGILENDFNNSDDPGIIADREEYSKQSMIFQYIFNGLNIEAAKTTDNPIAKLFAEFLSLPLLKTIMGGLSRSASTVAPVLNNLLYILFLYEFLKVETVYVAGYRANNINNTGSFSPCEYFDCEPAIYKFKIGTSTKRGVANSKLLASLLKWITAGRTELLKDFKLFTDSEKGLSKEDQEKLAEMKSKFTDVKDDLVALEPSNWPQSTDCDTKYPYKEDPGINPKSYFQNFENKLCKLNNYEKKFAYGMSKTTGVINNTVEGVIDIIKGGKASEAFLKEMTEFVTEKGIILMNVIGGNMKRFTTWCHQNYELNPNIMINRYPNGGQDNSTYGIGNLRRRPDSICSSLSTCALSNATMPDQEQYPVEYQTISLPHATFKVTSPYKENDGLFIILCFIAIVGIILLWVVLYKRRKN